MSAPELLTREQVKQLAEHLLTEYAHPEVFDTEGAAKYLRVSHQLLELMRVDGGGPRYAKLGRLVRYRRATLDAWLAERERNHTSEGA
jgi:excisionase family DNA binding protein